MIWIFWGLEMLGCWKVFVFLDADLFRSVFSMCLKVLVNVFSK